MAITSISGRLIVGASLWIMAALAIAAVFLTAQFRDHVERALDADLQDHIAELLTLVVVDPNGQSRLARHPVDPRFQTPYSGWYWEIRHADGRVERSQSLAGGKIDVSVELKRAVVTFVSSAGPHGKPLRVAGQTFHFEVATEAFDVVLAGPAADLASAAREFAVVLTTTLFVLAVGLVVAVILQVRFGLRPLDRMRERLVAMREGGGEARMNGRFSTEIQPLADELDALFVHNAALIERARTQAGNLAHALKTPLAVIANEADRLEGEAAEIIRGQTDLMAERVNHILMRARVVRGRRGLGARTDVRPVAEALRRTMEKIFATREISIDVVGMDGLAFRGDRHDFEELLGNLMENACKWANGRVHVWGRPDGAYMVLGVDDDGPGIPEDCLAEVLERGSRLDGSVPGAGLGLSIVCDLTEIYEGRLDLGRSKMGGLSARVRLPAV